MALYGEAPIEETVNYELIDHFLHKLQDHCESDGLKEVQRICDIGHRPARISKGRGAECCAERGEKGVLDPLLGRAVLQATL